MTAWEENFLNDIKNRLLSGTIWLSIKQQTKMDQIKDKLHYDRQHIPLPEIDPDGVEINDDPDGWIVVKEFADEFEDEDLLS